MHDVGDKENKGVIQNWLKFFTPLVHLIHFLYTVNEYPYTVTQISYLHSECVPICVLNMI